MQQTWYGIARKCDCGTDTNLYEVAFSADTELRFAFYCPKCRKSFGWRVFAAQLQHDAMCRDMAKGKPVTAPVVLTPEDFSDEDLKILKLMNITPPKETIQ